MEAYSIAFAEGSLRGQRPVARRTRPASAGRCPAEATGDCVYSSLLQAVQAPILMLGGDEILFRNAAAGRLMQQGVFAENARRLVRFSNPAAHGLLERVRRGKALAGTELLRSDGAQPPIIMQAMRLGRSTAGGARSDAPIVVVFIQLTAAGANRRRAIDTFTLFSRSERDVLARLVNGHSVEAIAKARNRAVATVRWHVKKMLMKSGARSIQDLTRMGALLAPF